MLYKITKENGNKKIKKNKEPEHHLTFTRKMSTSISHTPSHTQHIGVSGAYLAEDVAAVLEEYNSIYTVKVLLVDNTSTNIGFEAGSGHSSGKKN